MRHILNYRGLEIDVEYYVEEEDRGTYEAGGVCVSPYNGAYVVCETAEILIRNGTIDITELLDPSQWDEISEIITDELR